MFAQRSPAHKTPRRIALVSRRRSVFVLTGAYALLGCACLWLCLLTRVQAQSPGETVRRAEAELEALSRSRFQALVARDASALKKFYTPDFQAVGPDGEAVGVSFLEGIMRAAPKDFAIEPFAFRCLVSADNSQGVVFHKSHDVWEGQKSDVAYTEVYERREGRWLLRFEQYAELPAPVPAPVKTP